MSKTKYIESPEKMASLFVEYSQFCKANPKYENVLAQKFGSVVKVEREVPLTWDGFEIWLADNDILQKLDDYKENKDNRYSEYADIITRIGKIIWVDKYNGAAAGVFNPNIIARDLGLRDTTATELTGKGGGPVETIDYNKLDNDTLLKIAGARTSNERV